MNIKYDKRVKQWKITLNNENEMKKTMNIQYKSAKNNENRIITNYKNESLISPKWVSEPHTPNIERKTKAKWRHMNLLTRSIGLQTLLITLNNR